MQDLLSAYDFLDVEFVKAIDGRTMTEEERHLRFDYDGSVNLYGRNLNAGEIGCAMSHRKVYELLLNNDNPYALVLEDDIKIFRDLNAMDLQGIESLLNDSKPRVMMLSGDYGYYNKQSIVRLYSAVGAYAYIINKAAARLILAINPPCSVADDWMFYKRKGLKLYAAYPYMVDANVNMELLGSDVKQDSWSIDRSKMPLKEIMIGAYTGIVKRLFKLFGHFEYKVRVLDDIVVDNSK